MNNKQTILLPGTDKQLKFFNANADAADKTVLVMGAASEQVAVRISEIAAAPVDMIVEDYDSLMNAKLNAEGVSGVRIRLMDFEVTDFDNDTFDIVFAQASLSDDRRNKIIKEIKRVLKPEGLLCVGEMVSLTEEPPPFVDDIFVNAGIIPHYVGDMINYYAERGFEAAAEADLSESLTEYYKATLKSLEDSMTEMTDSEKSYHKKLLKQASHESKSYLNSGGDEHIGFKALLLKRKEN